MTDISATDFFRRQAGATAAQAAEPSFEHEEIDTGGTKRPTKIHLHAHDPATGDRMGTLTYHVPRRKADKILVEELATKETHQRKGVGSALMDEMQRRHPGTPIDHGDRTPAGKAWWNGYTRDKKVTRGRTMASASKPCPCCGGTGEHGIGSECYHCDGGRTVPPDSPDDATCDGTLPDGGHSRTALIRTAELGVYGPPDRWYHSSPHNLEETGFEEGHTKAGADQEYGKHWNSHLGIHLTSHHLTAIELAEGVYGTVHHVSWSAQNPKHYTSEHDLTHEAHDWAATHPSFKQDMPQVNDPYMGETETKETALRQHPRIDQVAHGFRDHLKAQGHDGITYGNEHEGPRGHVSAIAFSPHEASIDGAHTWDDDDDDHLNHLPARQATTTPVPDNTQPYQHHHDWLPRDHFFAPGKKGLDPRLFDGDRMHPAVRQHLLGMLQGFWSPKYGDSWQSWARVYLAGSEASHFYGNDDLDILIGIDYDAARHHVDAFTGEPDGALDKKLTDELREGMNNDHCMLPGPDGDATGPYENTWYVNPGSYDIRAIKPYAAYDITRDEWAVRPVEVPDDFGPEKLPESTWDVFDALKTLIKAVGELPAGVREREGAALYDYLHTDRHSAFGPDGTGLYDPANATWKALDKAPGAPLQQLIDWKHAHDGVAAATDQENAA
ncbi:N-acetyltransferase [Streptomyces sp. A0642]|uniref:GNAT family N-acetyltransferase n=1 Tax=Streptomyces sp. A0642 TaxID=2563100 RepID=UPI0010A29748|nr:GNAT family N-acetyltransferase [Streptomyces sp. A0642]THA72470.1 N-acetyltransferase [Streptomyces sp. A0642]